MISVITSPTHLLILKLFLIYSLYLFLYISNCGYLQCRSVLHENNISVNFHYFDPVQSPNDGKRLFTNCTMPIIGQYVRPYRFNPEKTVHSDFVCLSEFVKIFRLDCDYRLCVPTVFIICCYVFSAGSSDGHIITRVRYRWNLSLIHPFF